MKASDLMVKCLEQEGIEYIFGVPGEENADFMMSLEDSEKIRFILTRHEQGAAFMAEIYGRLTGNPAGCLGTLGPGATNLITGVADSNMDCAPMLVLTGQGASTRLHKESHQVMDVVGMFEPVTKWSQTILHPDNIPEIIRKAMRIARSEKPGACLVELPEDIAKQETDWQPISPRRYRRAAPEQDEVRQAIARVTAVKRPIVLAGNGCVRGQASRELRRFCEQTGIGAASTFMAKGCVDMDSEHCLYTVGLQSRDLISCAIEAADLIITVGFDMVEYHPRLWNPDRTKPVLHIDFLPAEIDAYYHPELELVGDVAKSLSMLNEGLAGQKFNFDLGSQAAARREMSTELAVYAEDDTQGSIRPQKALWDARQVLGPQDVLLSDVGAHKMWIARHYHCHEPNTCLIPNGFCSMGFALPGAIAAAMVYPQRRILGIAGDGGFLMNIQEMETAKRLGCNLVMLVWEDKQYGLIAWKQTGEFGRHTELAFNNPDWMGLAAAFGWHGHWVDRSVELADRLEAAFQEDGPSLVVIPIDYGENMKLSERLGQLVCPI